MSITEFPSEVSLDDAMRCIVEVMKVWPREVKRVWSIRLRPLHPECCSPLSRTGDEGGNQRGGHRRREESNFTSIPYRCMGTLS